MLKICNWIWLPKIWCVSLSFCDVINFPNTLLYYIYIYCRLQSADDMSGNAFLWSPVRIEHSHMLAFKLHRGRDVKAGIVDRIGWEYSATMYHAYTRAWMQTDILHLKFCLMERNYCKINYKIYNMVFKCNNLYHKFLTSIKYFTSKWTRENSHGSWQCVRVVCASQTHERTCSEPILSDVAHTTAHTWCMSCLISTPPALALCLPM